MYDKDLEVWVQHALVKILSDPRHAPGFGAHYCPIKHRIEVWTRQPDGTTTEKFFAPPPHLPLPSCVHALRAARDLHIGLTS